MGVLSTCSDVAGSHESEEELRSTTPSPELLRLPERPDASPSSARVGVERCRRSVRRLYVTK